MDSNPTLLLAVSRWFRENRDNYPAGVKAELREPSGEHFPASASIQFSSPVWAALAVVWENGAAETILASALSSEAPAVTVYQVSRPEEVVAMLSSLLESFSRTAGED